MRRALALVPLALVLSACGSSGGSTTKNPTLSGTVPPPAPTNTGRTRTSGSGDEPPTTRAETTSG